MKITNELLNSLVADVELSFSFLVTEDSREELKRRFEITITSELMNQKPDSTEFRKFQNQKMSSKEAALFLGISVDTLRDRKKKGVIKAHKKGNRTYYLRNELTLAEYCKR